MLEIEKEDEDIMHAMLGKLPQPFDVEFHIARSLELYERLPPEKLDGWLWWNISSSSVLKTSSTPEALNSLTLEDGERWMRAQEKEVRRRQFLARANRNLWFIRRRLWVYRRQGVFGLAIIVGACAIWLGPSVNTSRFPMVGLLGHVFNRLVSIVR